MLKRDAMMPNGGDFRALAPVVEAIGRAAMFGGLGTLAGLLHFTPVMANDSSASLDAGGLQLVQNNDIRLESEDLYLSLKEIRVTYRFRNSSSYDVSTLVAFPLPVMWIGEEGNYVLDGSDPINVVDFQVAVDGQRVVPSVEVKATRAGVDVTDVLKRYGIPLTMQAGDTKAYVAQIDRLDQLPGDAQHELEHYGVVDWVTSSGTDGKPRANVHWNAHITFYWFQVFPAGRAIEVTHRYHPVPRHFFFGEDDLAASAGMRKTYCIDAAFDRSARAELKLPSQEFEVLAGRELKYVLTTAGNWLGPIGKFRLTVDKSTPDALVSLCAHGIKRTGPTTFELSRDNYRPAEDLKVLFVEPLSKAD